MKTKIIKERTGLLVILAFLGGIITAQPQPNLVPNPSFEGKDCCPQGPTDPQDYPNITCLQDWRLPREKNVGDCIGSGQCVGSPDYLHVCDYSVYTPGPRTGAGYARIWHGGNQSKDYEYICNKLTSKLIKDNLYYVEFYVGGGNTDRIGAFFSDDIPRQHRSNRIKEYLTLTIEPQVDNPPGRVIDVENSLYWVKVSGYFIADQNDLEWITIGTFAKPGETLGTPTEFFYIDDGKVIDLGPKCNCVNERYIENTTYDYPEPVIRADNQIVAGYNVDNLSVYDGNVVLRSGAEVTYKATNVVTLLNEFYVNAGAEFTAVNENCNLAGAPLTMNPLPNVITPNGDGINDLYCVTQSGANQFEIFIRAGHFGALVYNGTGEIGSNSTLVCMWDGHCNTGITCSGQSVSDGWYTATVRLSNCQEVKEDTRLFYVNGPARYMNPALSGSEVSFFNIYPNPSAGSFTLEVTEDMLGASFEVLDMLGKAVYRAVTTDKETKVDLTDVEGGIYYVQIKSSAGTLSKKIIKQ